MQQHLSLPGKIIALALATAVLVAAAAPAFSQETPAHYPPETDGHSLIMGAGGAGSR